MRSKQEIFKDIKKNFQDKTNIDIEDSPVMAFHVDAVSGALENVYIEIYNIKSPYIFTNTVGEDLDGIGFLVNCPREPEEADDSYLHRLMNWNLRAQAGNITAINDALLNLEYSSDAKYVPYTHGAGTGSIFITPKNSDQVEEAIQEIKQKIKNVVSPGMYLEYISPDYKPVNIMAYIRSKEGDIEYIKEKLKTLFEEYIGSIAPGDSLEVGRLNNIAYEQPLVDFFNILEIKINGQVKRELSIIQEIRSKFYLNQMLWVTK